MVLEAVEKVSRSEPTFAQALSGCCPELLEALQKKVLERLKASMDGADVRVLQVRAAWAWPWAWACTPMGPRGHGHGRAACACL